MTIARVSAASAFGATCFLGVLLCAEPALQGQEEAAARSEARYEVVVEKDIRIPVRDGTRLALDLYLPAQDGKPVPGKHPTLLARTPYNKNGAAAEARWFAARGYAVVVNDVRGRYASEGSWRMIVDDPDDGADVLGWIGRQPWSTGK